MLCSELFHRSQHQFGHLGHFLIVFIRVAGPEETLQAVVPAPGDDMHVEMGHALADPVVQGDKASLCGHRCLDRAGKQTDVAKEPAGQLLGEVREGLAVHARDQEGMAGEEWPVVEERQGNVVGKHRRGRRFLT